MLLDIRQCYLYPNLRFDANLDPYTALAFVFYLVHVLCYTFSVIVSLKTSCIETHYGFLYSVGSISCSYD